MSNLDKNILITPNVGSNNDPTIVFSAANTTSNAANITMRAYPTSNGTLSFEGSAGQLFSITNQLTGTLFSVNDISGIPSIEVLDTGRINLAQYNGNVVIGASTSANASTSNTTGELVVFGGVGVTGNIYVGGTSAGSNGIYTDVLRYAANGLPWVISGGTPTTAFSRVVISGQPDAIANIANSPLTLVAGSGISLATNGVANSITISSTGGGGGGNVSASGYTANTIITADSGGFLGDSGSFFVASNNAIVVPNVSITQAATASFPLSFGAGIGNKIGLFDNGSSTGYGFGIQSQKLQIFHNASTDHTSFGHGSSSSFTEQFRVAGVASSVNYLQVSGATTSNTPALSAQGSDTNISMSLIPKGTGGVLINQTYSQNTVNVGSTLQVTGNVAANGSILAQNLYVQGGSNWLLQSVNLQSASWLTHSGDAGATTVTASLVLAPDGTTTAWQLNNSGGQTDPMRGIYQPASGTTSTGPWIASVWLRAGTLSSARVSLSGASDDNIVANTLVTLTSSWQRVVISGFTGLPYSASSGVRFKLSTNAATGNYLVWGPQVELANPTSIRSVASPYTPTSTSTVIASNNNIYVTNTVASANLVVSNIVGFANSNNIVSVYQSYNASTNSLDVVFG